MTGESAEAIGRDVLRGGHIEEPAPNHGPVRCASDPYLKDERYGMARKLAATKNWDAALAELKAAELRGMGGAGFPTSMKWDLVRKQPGDEKYVVCNADESEPGTIKDRFILTHLPHLVIEGMILAGLISGATKGILYIRHEYSLQEEILHEEIRRCYREGFLGKTVFGSDLHFDLELFVSPGGYICGEESALIEAIEGKRAEPRNKPPFPVQAGLWQKPTVLNNVETFANVPQILARGVDWFKAQGRNGSRGLKFVGVSGHVARPGVFEVPMGCAMREVIFDHAGGIRGGRQLKAFAPSGPSSGYLPASMVDVRVDFKALADAGSMLGSGAIVVCDDTHLHAGHGAERGALLSQRILRQVRAVPRRLAKDGGFTGALDARRSIRIAISRRPRAARRTFTGDESRIDLRSRPDRSRADSVRAETFPRRG